MLAQLRRLAGDRRLGDVEQLADPDLALVQARIQHAGYWDTQQSKIVQLFHIAKAAVTGQPPKLGEHAQIRLS